MFAKAAVISVLFSGSALAAPTSSPRPNELERRADWQEGKCEAHIYLNSESQVFSRLKSDTTNKISQPPTASKSFPRPPNGTSTSSTSLAAQWATGTAPTPTTFRSPLRKTKNGSSSREGQMRLSTGARWECRTPSRFRTTSRGGMAWTATSTFRRVRGRATAGVTSTIGGASLTARVVAISIAWHWWRWVLRMAFVGLRYGQEVHHWRSGFFSSLLLVHTRRPHWAG